MRREVSFGVLGKRQEKGGGVLNVGGETEKARWAPVVKPL